MSYGHIERALTMRPIIEQAAQSLPDSTALAAVALYPLWSPGVEYAQGYKVQHGGQLWRCIQAHTSLEGWEPENAASLWEQINETNAGSLADPIPYNGNMALTAGLYYAQDGVVYRCIRDTGNPVYHALRDLVGLYVEKV